MRIERTASFIDERDVDGSILPQVSGFIGLQYLLCKTWLQRKNNPRACPIIATPTYLVNPLHSAARFVDTPDKVLAWRKNVFDVDPKDVYLTAHYNPRRVSLTPDLRIQIVKSEDHGESFQEVEEDEVERIALYLESATSNGIYLEVAVENHTREDQWIIDGETLSKNIYTGCFVQIDTTCRSRDHLIMWYSNNEHYEIHPTIDKALGDRVQIGRPISKDGYRTIIPSTSGFPIDSERGVELCIAAYSSDGRTTLNDLRSSIIDFFHQNPPSSFETPIIATIRHLKGSQRRRAQRRALGAVPSGRRWDNRLFEMAFPDGAFATILTIPVIRQRS